MKLVRSEYKNYRQIKHQVIFYPQEGTIGLLGKNGAGKSTTLGGLEWCFYGKLDDITQDMIKNQSAAPSEECFVMHDFYKGKDFYRVKRDLKSKTKECYVRKNGNMAAQGASNVSKYIEEELFKMDQKAFRVCYYAAQDDFDALTKLNPAPRVKMLSKLLRIDEIDACAKETRDEYKELSLKVEAAKEHLKDTETVIEEKKVLERKIKEITKMLKELEKEIKKLDDAFSKKYTLQIDKSKDYKKYTELSWKKQTLEAKIETLENGSLKATKNRYEELVEQEKRYNKIKDKKEEYLDLVKKEKKQREEKMAFLDKVRLEKELKETKSQIEKMQIEKEKLEKHIKQFGEIDHELEEKQKKVKKMQEKREELAERYTELKTEMKHKKDKYDESKKMEQSLTCPTCERPFDNYEEKKKEIQKQVSAILEEMKKMKKEKEEIEREGLELKTKREEEEKRIESVRKNVLEKNKLEERLAGLEDQLSTRKEKLSSYELSLEKLKDNHFNEKEYERLLTRLDELTEIYREIIAIEPNMEKIPVVKEELKEIMDEIEKNKEEKKEKEKELKNLGFNEQEYDNLTEEIEELRKQLDEKKSKKKDGETEALILQKEVEVKEDKIKEFEKLRKQVKKDEEEMVILAKEDKILQDYKKDKLSKLAPDMSKIMSHLIDRLTNGLYDLVELDKDYNIHIYKNGIKNKLAFYSGGEKKLSALCQRLAISEMLISQTGQGQFDLLALDEVFGAMDNERQDNILDMLRNLNEIFPQILLVTHAENVKDGIDYLLELKRDSEGHTVAEWKTKWDYSHLEELVEEYAGEEEN